MDKKEVPATRLGRLFHWLDQRTALNKVLKVSLDEPIPGGARWAYVFGSGLLFLFISQVITGICLAIYYVPSAQSAHVSVAYITKQVAAGDFLRSLHYYGSSAMVIVLVLHFLQTFLFGAYKGRRELLWISGGTLALLVTGMAFTGYLLPWDQKAYFATAVGTNLVSKVPFIGEWMEKFMRGGDTIGTLTLSRFYIAHVILIPACIFGIIAVHIYLFRKAGAAGPMSEDPIEPKQPPESFYPKQVVMDMAFAMVLMGVLGLLALIRPVGLGPRANPASTTYLPRPEWYFLPVFEWLKFWEGPRTIFGVVLIPGALALLFFLLPFLDRKLERRFWRRPIPLLSVAIVFLGMIFLGLLSHHQDMEHPFVRKQLALQAAQEKAYDKKPFKPYMQAPGSLSMLSPAKSNPMVARGKALFSKEGCSGCHGMRGRGAVGPSLVGIVKSLGHPKVMSLIEHPTAAMHSAGMPAHFNMTTHQVAELVSYLNALGTPEENVQPQSGSASASSTSSSAPAAQTASSSAAAAQTVSTAKSASSSAPASKQALIAQGHKIFKAQACFACHGNMAQGTPRAPTLAGWAAKTPASVIKKHITHPTAAMQAKGMMPHNLPPNQLNAVVAFLKSLPTPSKIYGVPGTHPVTHAATHPHPQPQPQEEAQTQPQAQPQPKPQPKPQSQQQVHSQLPPSAPAAAPAVAKPASQQAAKASAAKASQSAAATKEEIARGRFLFQHQPCQACHGPMAQGTPVAPPLGGIWRLISEPTFYELIHHPTPPMTSRGMPPATVSEKQTQEIWAFLKSLPIPANAVKTVPLPKTKKHAHASSKSKHASQKHVAATAHAAAPTHVAKKAPAPAAAPKAKPTTQTAALTGPAAVGRQIFVSHGCIGCHGEHGQGTRLAISLIGVTNKFSKSALAKLIRHPNAKMKAGGMPTFTYTDPQMKGLLAYLSTLNHQAASSSKSSAAAPVHHAPPHKLTPEEQAGKRVYQRERCSTCHGTGGMEGTAAAPSLTATASELPPDMIKHLLQHPSQAMRAKGMPAVSVSNSDLNALIAYIRSLRYNR